MPELPEVETTLGGIAPHITSQMIKNVVVRDSRYVGRSPMIYNKSSLARE